MATASDSGNSSAPSLTYNSALLGVIRRPQTLSERQLTWLTSASTSKEPYAELLNQGTCPQRQQQQAQQQQDLEQHTQQQQPQHTQHQRTQQQHTQQQSHLIATLQLKITYCACSMSRDRDMCRLRIHHCKQVLSRAEHLLQVCEMLPDWHILQNCHSCQYSTGAQAGLVQLTFYIAVDAGDATDSTSDDYQDPAVTDVETLLMCPWSMLITLMGLK